VRTWLRLADAIDSMNEKVGVAISWLALVMVLIGAFNAIARYLGRHIGANLSSNAYIELQWYLFSLLFLLGAAYTLKHHAHVRVDVLYARLSPRGRAGLNLVGTLFLFMPFCIFALVVSWEWVLNSWTGLEGSPDPGGLPRYPIKTMVLVSFALLILQGVAEVIRQIAILRGHDVDEEEVAPIVGEGV